jgi:hypothetical protein
MVYLANKSDYIMNSDTRETMFTSGSEQGLPGNKANLFPPLMEGIKAQEQLLA